MLEIVRRRGVEVSLYLVGPGTVGTVVGAGFGAAAATLMMGPCGAMYGAMYGAKGGGAIGLAGAAVTSVARDFLPGLLAHYGETRKCRPGSNICCWPPRDWFVRGEQSQ